MFNDLPSHDHFARINLSLTISVQTLTVRRSTSLSLQTKTHLFTNLFLHSLLHGIAIPFTEMDSDRTYLCVFLIFSADRTNVCRLMSVTYVLWLNGAFYRKTV